MASKRTPIHSNFRPSNLSSSKWETKGTKPLPDPSSVKKIFLMVLLFGCKKVMFTPTNVLRGYALALFLISVIGKQMPIPKTFFSRSDNFLNLYFVKLGWLWTLIVAFPFILLTSFVYCSGKRDRILKHLARLVVATGFWFFLTKFFVYIESNVGSCIGREPSKEISKLNKIDCISGKHFWRGFDISGHTFLLIYSMLILIEETKVIQGWETIEDFIRNEEHTRQSKSQSNGPLSNLSAKDFECVKISYSKFTSYIRGLFIGITALVIIWNVMLISTMIYFHDVSEKLISGIIAVFSWFITYKVWFAYPHVLPYAPGEGDFKYFKDTASIVPPPRKKRNNIVNEKGERIPTFLGMPLYGLQTQKSTQSNGSRS
ncbi:unnamed protein product [Bemisia tabaci]|uniref:Fat storage-inducing transmembrane protein n=1 Tax=Bemisia tabaci TaxID=7038 RepID=A0A9P0A0G9_BEMTA|nr:PREDICTED: FIT family protein CG10671 [Bemisia tabaci]CAH0380908.1 unnamed protein product [Bemisia tabaci]